MIIHNILSSNQNKYVPISFVTFDPLLFGFFTKHCQKILYVKKHTFKFEFGNSNPIQKIFMHLFYLSLMIG